MVRALLPALQFSPTLSYICLMFGLIFEMTNLIWLGVLFFGLMVIFSLLTVPVELDASRRGLSFTPPAFLPGAWAQSHWHPGQNHPGSG